MIKIDPNSLAFDTSSRQKLLNRLKICMCILLVFNSVRHGSNST